MWFEQTLIKKHLVTKVKYDFWGSLSCSAGPPVTQIPEFSQCLTDPSGMGWAGNPWKSWAPCSCLGRAVSITAACTTGSKSLVRTCGASLSCETLSSFSQKLPNPVLASNVDKFSSLSWVCALQQGLPSCFPGVREECAGWEVLRGVTAAEFSPQWLPAWARGRSRAWILILQGEHRALFILCDKTFSSPHFKLPGV